MKFELNAYKRELQGSGASRRLRRANKVPGIIYGGSAAPDPCNVRACAFSSNFMMTPG